MAADGVAFKRRRAADYIAVGLTGNQDAGGRAVGHRGGAGEVNADEIALDDVALSGQVVLPGDQDLGAAVAGNDVVDHLVAGSGEEAHAVQPVPQDDGTRRVEADYVVFNPIVGGRGGCIVAE